MISFPLIAFTVPTGFITEVTGADGADSDWAPLGTLAQTVIAKRIAHANPVLTVNDGLCDDISSISKPRYRRTVEGQRDRLGRARLSVGPINEFAALSARLKVGPFPVPLRLRNFMRSLYSNIDSNTAQRPHGVKNRVMTVKFCFCTTKVARLPVGFPLPKLSLAIKEHPFG